MQDLLDGRRYDLFPKIIYARNYLNNTPSQWYVDLYKDHIGSFNGFWEYPGVKNTSEQFIMSFNSLIDSMRKNGYDKSSSVTISSNGVLSTGAHRFCSAYSLGIKPEITIDSTGGNGYNYDFFVNRHKHEKQGPESAIKQIKDFPLIWSDTVAIEMCKIHPTIKIITFYPRADRNKDSTCEQMMSRYGTIMYKKSFQLTNTGLLNLITELYYQEKWVGYTFNDKQRDTQGPNPVRTYVFLPNKNCDIKELKNKLRFVYNIGNNSVHINDTQQQAIRYAQTFLHPEMLNSIIGLSGTNLSYFQQYKQYLESVKNPENFCVSSSFILSIMGLRTARDMDILHLSPLTIGNNNISSHLSEEKYYHRSITDIVLDPREHFYIHGVKFTLPHVVLNMKRKRDEEKDRRDILLLEKSTLDQFVDKIFIINLRDRTDKYNLITNQLGKFGIKNYERFDAIRPTPEIITSSNIASIFKSGIIGCKQSHIEVIKEAKKRNYRQILILEDDADLVENFIELFSHVVEEQKNIPWQMLYLGANHRKQGVNIENCKYIKRCFDAFTTSSYIIRDSLYDTVISTANKNNLEIDTFYVEEIQKNHLCIACSPNIITQRPSWSDISGNFTNEKFGNP